MVNEINRQPHSSGCTVSGATATECIGAKFPVRDRGPRSEELYELIAGEAGVFDDRVERTALEVAHVDRNDDADRGPVRMLEDRAGSGGVVYEKSRALESSDRGFRGARGQASHARARVTATRSVIASPCSTGISSPSFCRLSR